MIDWIPPRDAGAGSGALQAFQQVGGALGVALVGELFFTSLANGFQSGGSPHQAFAGAASFAIYYQIASFALVVLLVPFLRPAGTGEGQGGRPVAAPIPAEA